MSAEENKTIVRRFYEELISSGDVLSSKIISPEYVFVNPGFGPLMGLGEMQGLLTILRQGFPDMALTVEELIAEGDKVAARFTIRGTHQGDYQGIPATGKSIAVRAFAILRIADGKIVEEQALADQLSWMQQLGAVLVPPGQAGR